MKIQLDCKDWKDCKDGDIKQCVYQDCCHNEFCTIEKESKNAYMINMIERN